VPNALGGCGNQWKRGTPSWITIRWYSCQCCCADWRRVHKCITRGDYNLDPWPSSKQHRPRLWPAKSASSSWLWLMHFTRLWPWHIPNPIWVVTLTCLWCHTITQVTNPRPEPGDMVMSLTQLSHAESVTSSWLRYMTLTPSWPWPDKRSKITAKPTLYILLGLQINPK